MTSIIDNSSAAAIKAAIRKVNQTPELRDRAGMEALWRLFKAPNHSMPHDELVTEFGTPNLHFGWLCRRVAERLEIAIQVSTR
jgi:hypothetical protein